MSDEPLSSAGQDAWAEIAAAAREQLRRRLPDMGAMTPEELGAFLEACRTAQGLEQDAATHDREVELRRSRLSYHD